MEYKNDCEKLKAYQDHGDVNYNLKVTSFSTQVSLNTPKTFNI